MSLQGTCLYKQSSLVLKTDAGTAGVAEHPRFDGNPVPEEYNPRFERDRGVDVTPEDLAGCLTFIREAERLKNVLRSAHTSTGRPESTAEHTWRLCLMAIVFQRELGALDFAKVLKICVMHDLGEAIGGDIPAVEQQSVPDKGERERNDLLELMAPLPDSLREELLALWDEYENASTAEGRIVKALDKLETIIQHNQGANPEGFDYAFNLEYGQKYTAVHPLLAQVRAIVDEETRRRVQPAAGQ